MKLSLKEFRETRVWRIMFGRAKLLKPTSKFEPLIKENNEMISIFVTSINTARRNKKKTS